MNGKGFPLCQVNIVFIFLFFFLEVTVSRFQAVAQESINRNLLFGAVYSCFILSMSKVSCTIANFIFDFDMPSP